MLFLLICVQFIPINAEELINKASNCRLESERNRSSTISGDSETERGRVSGAEVGFDLLCIYCADDQEFRICLFIRCHCSSPLSWCKQYVWMSEQTVDEWTHSTGTRFPWRETRVSHFAVCWRCQANLRAVNEELRNHIQELTSELDSCRAMITTMEKEKVGFWHRTR